MSANAAEAIAFQYMKMGFSVQYVSERRSVSIWRNLRGSLLRAGNTYVIARAETIPSSKTSYD